MIDFLRVLADEPETLGAARMVIDGLRSEIVSLQEELRVAREQLPEGYIDVEGPHLRVLWEQRAYAVDRVVRRPFTDWIEARDHSRAVRRALREERIMGAIAKVMS